MGRLDLSHMPFSALIASSPGAAIARGDVTRRTSRTPEIGR